MEFRCEDKAESFVDVLYFYLMQFSGSPSQSVLHRNRSHDSQPMGGVRASPFSRAEATCKARHIASTSVDTFTLGVAMMG